MNYRRLGSTVFGKILDWGFPWKCGRHCDHAGRWIKIVILLSENELPAGHAGKLIAEPVTDHGGESVVRVAATTVLQMYASEENLFRNHVFFSPWVFDEKIQMQINIKIFQYTITQDLLDEMGQRGNRYLYRNFCIKHDDLQTTFEIIRGMTGKHRSHILV